jgi:hypothetical protein
MQLHLLHILAQSQFMNLKIIIFKFLKVILYFLSKLIKYLGAERLLAEFRIVCNSIYQTKIDENNLTILPLILLPEQVQILVENG